jgi:glutathione S-transferase
VKIYGASISPFVRKVIVFAIEKGLDFEHVPLGLGAKAPEFLSASPFSKIPGFVDGDLKISDSSAIVHYLDAKYPAVRLIPQDPEGLARTVWFDEFADTIAVASMGKIFFNRIVAPRFLKRDGDEAMAEQGVAELPRLFDYLEGVVPDAGGFLVGGTFGLADISVAAPFVNLGWCGIRVDPATHPRLAAYLDAILSRPSFARVIEADDKVMAA